MPRLKMDIQVAQSIKSPLYRGDNMRLRKNSHGFPLARMLGVADEYQLSQRSNLFFFHTDLDNDRNGLADFSVDSLGLGRGTRLKVSAAGLRHTFEPVTVDGDPASGFSKP